MKQFLALIAAAAFGSAATYYATVVRQAPPALTVAAETARAERPRTPVAPKADGAAEETPRKSGSSKFGGRNGGNFLPEEIDGVSKEDLTKCKTAMFKTFQDEDVRAARAKMTELRKEAEYASDDQKKDMRAQFEEVTLGVRKATKAAMLAADPSLSDDTVDKVLDAVEERAKQRIQQYQQQKAKAK
ncbi:MAG: hypothetical protein WCJ96_06595 [Verrucomicrobiota bacterium]|jgi:hypothetical protein